MTDKIKQLLEDISSSEDRIWKTIKAINNLIDFENPETLIRIEGAQAKNHKLTPQETTELTALLGIWLERERDKFTDLLHTARVIEDLLMEP